MMKHFKGNPEKQDGASVWSVDGARYITTKKYSIEDSTRENGVNYKL
jgi:hypothetical protein